MKLQSLAKNILQESPAVYKDSFIHERFDVLLVSIISIKYNDHKYIRNPTSKIGKQVKIKIWVWQQVDKLKEKNSVCHKQENKHSYVCVKV